ncbi:thiol-disulfide oxidoreductase DCC family protein [Bacillus changyiensis]|uniref:thiol-disulfide oxidoreductase DCC family protein n=1 Tax=Bacillus changyiensis TaxID=3004103 RepID=UPI0022E2B956|nr:DCC1-like thiol-disulfide oxidoreductase family protein [Bacillus changyiensis]MDA1477339.1 DCC1-like thiol-disulfide oxidoreductase family protein [Bacillus changyiensis]
MRKKLYLTVLYDSWCPLCKRTSKIIRYLDVFNLINLTSFREKKEKILSPISVDLFEKKMYSINAQNKIYSGYDTILQIVVRTPLIIIYPFMYLMKITKIGYILYGLIARNRKVICKESCCHIPNCSETP